MFAIRILHITIIFLHACEGHRDEHEHCVRIPRNTSKSAIYAHI